MTPTPKKSESPSLSDMLNKTPAELASETPEESAARYNISSEIPDAVDENPNVEVYRDSGAKQIPSGTHLHPDVAKDNYNRALKGGTENATTSRVISQAVYADESPLDDTGRAKK